jgi:hypothetical protein
MWLLILIAVHSNNPQDQPGKVELTFQDQQTCQQVLSTMKWQLKFSSFKIVGNCIKQKLDN